jgi:hypothetical protein
MCKEYYFHSNFRHLSSQTFKYCTLFEQFDQLCPNYTNYLNLRLKFLIVSKHRLVSEYNL